MNQQEIIVKITEILGKQCDDPAIELIKMGQVFIDIGNAVKGLSRAEARAVISAASIMTDIQSPKELK